MKSYILTLIFLCLFQLSVCIPNYAQNYAQNYDSQTLVQPKIWTNNTVQSPTQPQIQRKVQPEVPPQIFPGENPETPTISLPNRGNTQRTASENLQTEKNNFTSERNSQKVTEESIPGNASLSSVLKKENLQGESLQAENTQTQEKDSEKSQEEEPKNSLLDWKSWVSPDGIQGSAVTFLILSAVSLAPAFLMMTTSFVRIFVVLGILRHGFGTQGIPGTQILAALALFMTFFIMFPTWERTWNEALVPYQAGALTSEEALKFGIKPIRDFMAEQLERAGNTDEILLFWRYSSTPPDEKRLAMYTTEDVPLHVLLPAFMLGELKTAFLIGVQLLIPMLVVDLLVSSILVSMGMFMLPPTMVSLPFKLLLFVLADGWRLVVEMLIGSFTGF